MGRIGWTQPLCESCYLAWLLGRDEAPRGPTRVIDPEGGDPCLVCGTATTIYTRIDPTLAALHRYPKPRDD
jgi:hypothetical protein